MKRHCYARAGIPLYLLVDRSAKSTSLFSAPEVGADDYREVIRVAFGKGLDLPRKLKISAGAGPAEIGC